MRSGADLSETITSLYDAAVGLESWSCAVKLATETLGAQSALLYTPTLPPDQGLFIGPAIDPAAFDDYAAYYHSKDLWFQQAQQQGLIRRGCTFVGEKLAPPSALKKSEWYNDFVAPMEISRVMCVIVSDDTHPLMPQIHFSLFRPSDHKFEDGERDRLSWLFPHLERALAIRFRMEECRTTVHGLTDVLDRLSPAIVVLMKDGRIARANHSAHALLKQGDGLIQRTAGLCATCRADDAALQRAILLATQGGSAAPLAATNLCTVSRPSGRRPLQLLEFRISSKATAQVRRVPAAVVFIIDPESATEVPADRVARLLGLTGAEARLAAALSAGTSLANYAEQAGISLGTARWTLKQVLAKTGSERQSALVALVLKSAIVRNVEN